MEKKKKKKFLDNLSNETKMLLSEIFFSLA